MEGDEGYLRKRLAAPSSYLLAAVHRPKEVALDRSKQPSLAAVHLPKLVALGPPQAAAFWQLGLPYDSCYDSCLTAVPNYF